jgi:prenylcysteine oxidase / farnesylcysteine lyase
MRGDQAPLTVAVVGAGIAGCAAAWFIRQSMGPRATIRVYEKSPRVGGRLATIDVDGTPIEAGGTIIHETNRIMAGFVDEFELGRVEPRPRPLDDTRPETVGVWDGQRLVFRTHPSALRTRIRAVRRFGILEPLRLQRAVRAAVSKWNGIYEHLDRGQAFDSPVAMLAELGLEHMLQDDGRSWLAAQHVKGRFVDEYADPVGRIMYGQDTSMNGFATSIALAGAGLAGSLFSVGGGNRRVCESLLSAADATVQTNAEVRSVRRDRQDDSGSLLHLELAGGESRPHGVVVFATPSGVADLALTGIDVPDSALRTRAFQTTWATFVKGEVRHGYFGEADPEALPDSVLTVESTAVPFSSLARVATSADGFPVYKVFSREQPDEALLDDLFARRDATEQRRWEAYPVLRPCADLAPFRLAPGLFWVNAMEFATSTMETQAVAARNVANLIAAAGV